jgi:hypothetical protein
MTMVRFLDILRLRYLLQWAQIRRSSGRLIWFIVVQVALGVIGVMAAIFGFGALVVAVQLGRAESIVQTILSVIFLNALVTSLVLGYGLNQALSDKSLRHYPLSYTERFVIRHMLGLFEPLWLITVAAYGGAAIAAALFGAAPVWVTVPAAVILVAINYLLVRFVLALSSLLMETAIGSVVLVALTQLVFFIPMSSRVLINTPERRALARATLMYTPPAAAGSIVSGAGTAAHVVVLAGWLALIVALLFWLDRLPDRSRMSRLGAASWNGPIDRIAALLSREWAPLVARGLRFYLRNPQVQIGFFSLVILVLVMPVYMTRRSQNAHALFETTLLVAPMLGTVTSVVSSNAFGFDRNGTRRLLLAPVPGYSMLASTSMASAMICATYLVIAVAIWTAVNRAAQPLMVMMLVTHGLTGLFLFHAIAAWSSVVTPSRADYYEKFRKQSSPGTIWTGVFMLAVLVITFTVRSVLLGGNLTDYWWLSWISAAAAAVVYVGTLKLVGASLTRRRERLLSVVEGRT